MHIFRSFYPWAYGGRKSLAGATALQWVRAVRPAGIHCFADAHIPQILVRRTDEKPPQNPPGVSRRLFGGTSAKAFLHPPSVIVIPYLGISVGGRRSALNSMGSGELNRLGACDVIDNTKHRVRK